MLQRLHSEVQEHYITLRMCIDHSQKYDEIDAVGFSFFNIHHTHGNVLAFRLEEDEDLETCLHFKISISMDTMN